MKAIILSICWAVAGMVGLASAEEREWPYWLGSDFVPMGVAPEVFPESSVWKSEVDEKLDGKLQATSSHVLVLESANGRVVGRDRAQQQDGNGSKSLLAGQVIAGAPVLVSLRQDDRTGGTTLYTGRVVSAGKIVGSYANNRGGTGDWSLALVTRWMLEPASSELPDEPLYESVLGVYGQAIRGDRHPLVNLRPPHRNLWTDEIRESVERVLSYENVDYIGTAKLAIREAGEYVVDIPGAGVELRVNGQKVEAGVVELKKGLYEVELYTNHWGQPYLTYAEVAVRKQGAEEAVPFVNTAADIEAFRSRKIGGKPVVEVCRYTATRIELDGE